MQYTVDISTPASYNNYIFPSHDKQHSVLLPSEFTGKGPQGVLGERKSKKAEKTWKNHEKMIDTHGTVYYNNRV